MPLCPECRAPLARVELTNPPPETLLVCDSCGWEEGATDHPLDMAQFEREFFAALTPDERKDVQRFLSK